MFKSIVSSILHHKVKKYFKTHNDIKLVVVTGSVGKTSTKHAIATVLTEGLRVRAHDENYNSEFSVPVAVMGVKYPKNPRSVSEWLEVFKAMNLRIAEPTDVDVIVQELGTDSPGDIKKFSSYLKPDIAVITAVSDEHMEFFKTREAVAKEELAVAAFSKLTVINRDDIDAKFAAFAETTSITTYGLEEGAEYRMHVEPASPLDGRIGQLFSPEFGKIPVTVQLVGLHSIKAAVAAAAVAIKLGLPAEKVAVGLGKIKPVPGRMRLLRGANDSVIIDDTYNSSPLAVAAALGTLYAIEAPQRIAVLGSMNELGETSPASHKNVGALCDPSKLDWVVTIGEDAEKYLAPAARAKGCQVKSFASSYQAGGFTRGVMKAGALVLAKGSQNGVFAEEAVKALLYDENDADQLVRQSETWMTKKQEYFDRTHESDT